MLRGMELMDRAAEAFSAQDAPHGHAGTSGSMTGAKGASLAVDDFVARVLAELETRDAARRYAPEGEIARGGQGTVLSV